MINVLGTFGYAYVGATGRVDHVDYPNGQRINYDYFDHLGDDRLKEIKNLGVGATPPILSQFNYTYDDSGEITTWTQVQGASMPQRYESRYDAANQLVGAILKNATTNAALKEYVYAYDPSGNRLQEQIDTNVTTSSFNTLNQLTGQTPAGAMEFSGTLNEPGTVTLGGQPASVDASNNWRGQAAVTPGANSIPLVATDVSGNTATKTISVSVTGGSARTVVYDLNGAMIDDGAGRVYAYDAMSRLVKITQGGNVTEFVYNGVGQRTQEKLNGTVIKQWIWSDGAQPSEERDSDSAVAKRFFSQGEQIDGSGYFYTTDHLGSLREMTDSSGEIRSRYSYDPYGRITKISGDLEADFGFTSFYRHQASGLNMTMYRAYDPELGRWTSRDFIGERGGLNLYAYVSGNPVNKIDLSGLVPGDPTYGLPKEFWSWAHKQDGFNELKGPDGNLSKEDALDLHRQWQKEKRPNPRKEKRCNRDDDDWTDDWPGGNPITPSHFPDHPGNHDSPSPGSNNLIIGVGIVAILLIAAAPFTGGQSLWGLLAL